MLLRTLMLTPVNRRRQPPGTGKYPTQVLDPATRVTSPQAPLRAPAPRTRAARAPGPQAWVAVTGSSPRPCGPYPAILLARFAEGGADLVEVLQDLPVGLEDAGLVVVDPVPPAEVPDYRLRLPQPVSGQPREEVDRKSVV